MFHNIKCLSLHRVFHGIRFKVNEDWESGKIPFFVPCRFYIVAAVHTSICIGLCMYIRKELYRGETTGVTIVTNNN